MTTKQDYVGSILQSLAGVIASDPSHSQLEAIDVAMNNFQRDVDPEGRNSFLGIEDAKEIIADFLDENS